MSYITLGGRRVDLWITRECGVFLVINDYDDESIQQSNELVRSAATCVYVLSYLLYLAPHVR